MRAVPQPNPVRRPPAKKSLTPWLIVGGAAAIGLGLTFLLIGGLVFLALMPERVAAGVQVAGLSLGNESLSAAKTELNSRFANANVTLTDSDRQWVIPMSDLGVQFDMDSTLQIARNANPGSNIIPVYTVDLNQAQVELASLSNSVNIAPVSTTPQQNGRGIDIPVTLDRLRVDVSGEVADGVLELDMMVVEPEPLQPGGSYTGATSTHVVESGEELGLIAKNYNVALEDIVALNGINDPNLLYVGQELLIPANGVFEPTAADAPPAPTNSGKSILVSTTQQRIYAYENGQLVHSHLASTGLPDTPTVLGDYSIYVKYTADDMSGPGYFLPQVPYTMYFYQGYAIHGTYWHNKFGRPMSHGCVNLPTDEAQWFFNWAEVGVPVRVI